MALQAIIFLLSAIFLILIVVNSFLFRYSYKTNKLVDELLEKGKIKDFKDIFLSQKEKNSNLEKELEEAFSRIKNLEEICETTVRKIGVIRFNPFNNMGGNQSFVIAMLDNKNNGFIISSMFAEGGSRIFTKTIKQGKSDYTLSDEEHEAINQAINYK